ncbi:major facilitator superfamily domain-containing protein [Apiospora phragmitis]|uniref:Major facilitator superfamily domain-containing protein n=1 Tax=Apiospora phragmitis TaxID=2905665 RepID=A0ABR1T3N0_9PEZI
MLFRKSKAPAATAAGADDASKNDNDHRVGAVDSGSTTTATADEHQQKDGGQVAKAVSRASTRAESDYPTGVRLALILLSIFVSMFLVALDRLIISTAIPQITDDFHSLPDVGWYGSAYLLTTCSFQLMFGKLYTFFSVKTVFLATVMLFEVGSAVCGAAPSSVVFIVGRAIAGVGAAGIFSGVIIIIVYAVPLHKRPLYQGLFGAVFGLASVVGPLVGGAFTSKVSWRWCFYINLPFGGVALAVVAFLLKIPDRDTTNAPLKEKLSQLDAIGTSVLIPGVVCLLLALQWGGLVYEWSNGRIIALLVLGGLLLIGFVLTQIFMPKTATVAPRIFKQRSIVAGFWATICIGSQMMIFGENSRPPPPFLRSSNTDQSIQSTSLPIWFQAIKGASAVDSGIRLLPLTLSMVVASMANGLFVNKIGYYTPSMIAGTCLLAIGAGLLTTLEIDTPSPKWIGYQIVYGFGMGLTFQAPNLAAQTVLPTKDVPTGTSLMFFSQLLGGAIFISVGQNVLNNQLLTRLSGLPGFSPKMISDNGATTLSQSLPPELLGPVLSAYNESLRVVFRVGLILTCLTVFGTAAMEFRSVKKNLPKKGAGVDADAEKGDATGQSAAVTEKKTDSSEVGEKAQEAGRDADQAKATVAETAAAGEPVPTGKSS